VHLAKEWAQIAKNKAFGRKKAIFNHSYSHNPLCYNSIADKEHGTDGSKKSKGNLHTLVFMNSTAQGGGGSFNQKPQTPNKGSGGRQSTLVTQSAGQAPLETQHFGRTTALQKGPGKI
jgi:hypothetical protein